MSGFGLQVFDASGVIVTDITDRLTSVFGNYTASINSTSSANPLVISAPGVDASGTYFAVGNAALASITLGTNVINVYWWWSGTWTMPITVFQC